MWMTILGASVQFCSHSQPITLAIAYRQPKLVTVALVGWCIYACTTFKTLLWCHTQYLKSFTECKE